MNTVIQERLFFMLICGMMIFILLTSGLCLLALEYRRWKRFMHEQRGYFRKLANRQLDARSKADRMTKQKDKLLNRGQMVAEKQISVSDAQPDMILAQDVQDSQGRILLRNGEVLTRDSLDRLKVRGIKYILI